VTALPAVLAIDGGGSKTDVALVAADGSLLASARGGASNHQIVGRDVALAVLTSLVREVAAKAGLAGGASVAEQSVRRTAAQAPRIATHIATHTAACLAGADLPDEEAELTAVITAQRWSATSTVVNDTFAVLRAGLDDAVQGQHWGIGVVCGQGTNCAGVAPDGRSFRFVALGSISGDWGGGGDLGPDALWWAARAEDGRGPDTELRRAVPAHFGLRTVEDVILGVYRRTIDYAQLFDLTPVLLAVAAAGDEVARGVVLRQADEICAMATVAARSLGLMSGGPDGTPVPVVLGGSVLAARDPLLTEAVTERLAARLPCAEVRIIDAPPVLGAALIGLDEARAPAAALVRLRSALAQPASPALAGSPDRGQAAGQAGQQAAASAS
jgi:N-acetylglucosamine kinase-like BadF-type ATPase